MEMKKIVTGALAAVMCMSTFTGCGKNKETSSDKVVLKYVMPGPGMQEDSGKVWAEWNKKLQEKLPNVEVKFEVIDVSEYQQNFALMLSAKEQMDIVNTYSLDFATEVQRGTFAPLDELLAQYGQGITSTLPDWFMDYQKVKGVTYGVPGYQMCGSIPALYMFKDVAEKYLDIDSFTQEFQSHYLPTEKAYDYLEDMIKKANADGLKFKTTERLWERGVENITQWFTIPMDPEAPVQVEYFKLSDSRKRDYERRREWYEKGYVREDSLSATDDNNYIGKKDGMPWWTGVYTPGYEKTLSDKYGAEVMAIPYYQGYYIPSKNSAAGTSILSNSQHKEEAMQVINLLQTDKELYNMLAYGVEGEHYTKIGEDRIETPTGVQGTSNDKYGLWPWILGDINLAYDLQNTQEGYKDWIFNEVNKSEWRSKLIGFTLDTTSIATALSQISSLADEYEETLNSGAMANYEELEDEWQRKFELAGGNDVLTEIQRQVDEFLKQ